MNPNEYSESLSPVIDMDSWLSFFHGRGGAAATMEDVQLEAELMNIINNNNIHTAGAAPAAMISMTTMASNARQRTGCYDFPSFMNSAEATSVTTTAVPRSYVNISTANTSASQNISTGNTSGCYNSSSALSATVIGGTTGGLPGKGTAKVKKKRVRASKRVPTTVLRTDTSNFKAMVQHFTGIPSDSSSSSSSSSSPSSSTTTSSVASSSSEAPFTKPLPHPAVCKIPPSPPNNSSTSTAIAAATTNNTEHVSLPLPSSYASHDISSPLLLANVFNADGANNGSPEDQTMPMSMSMSAMDAAFFEKLWS